MKINPLRAPALNCPKAAPAAFRPVECRPATTVKYYGSKFGNEVTSPWPTAVA